MFYATQRKWNIRGYTPVGEQLVSLVHTAELFGNRARLQQVNGNIGYHHRQPGESKEYFVFGLVSVLFFAGFWRNFVGVACLSCARVVVMKFERQNEITESYAIFYSCNIKATKRILMGSRGLSESRNRILALTQFNFRTLLTVVDLSFGKCFRPLCTEKICAKILMSRLQFFFPQFFFLRLAPDLFLCTSNDHRNLLRHFYIDKAERVVSESVCTRRKIAAICLLFVQRCTPRSDGGDCSAENLLLALYLYFHVQCTQFMFAYI